MPDEARIFPAHHRVARRYQDQLQYRSIEGATGTGSLLCFDEFVLAKGGKIAFNGSGDLLYLLPLVGAVQVNDRDRTLSINPGQSALLSFAISDGLTLANPEQEEITFLRAVVKGNPLSEISDVDLDAHPDKLLVPHPAPAIRVGQFSGRKDCALRVSSAGVFFFVIEGAFEVQGRLLERRDGLLMLNVNEVEFESLSDHAIIWVMEI